MRIEAGRQVDVRRSAEVAELPGAMDAGYRGLVPSSFSGGAVTGSGAPLDRPVAIGASQEDESGAQAVFIARVCAGQVG